jgi:hypothetical protein
MSRLEVILVESHCQQPQMNRNYSIQNFAAWTSTLNLMTKDAMVSSSFLTGVLNGIRDDNDGAASLIGDHLSDHQCAFAFHMIPYKCSMLMVTSTKHNAYNLTQYVLLTYWISGAGRSVYSVGALAQASYGWDFFSNCIIESGRKYQITVQYSTSRIEVINSSPPPLIPTKSISQASIWPFLYRYSQ